MSSKPGMLGNRAVTPNASPELHRKQECISSPFRHMFVESEKG